jgi:putative addiction module component (TIGR02574 family)
MATIRTEILEKALSLPPSERASLVGSLLASLDQPDPRIDELWAREAERRLAAFEAGQMTPVAADKVFEELDGL